MDWWEFCCAPVAAPAADYSRSPKTQVEALRHFIFRAAKQVPACLCAEARFSVNACNFALIDRFLFLPHYCATHSGRALQHTVVSHMFACPFVDRALLPLLFASLLALSCLLVGLRIYEREVYTTRMHT